MDPSQLFDQLAGGKDILNRTDITNQFMGFMFDNIARQANITNGQLTRQQFVDGLTQLRQQFPGRGGFGRGNGPGGAGGGLQGAAGAAPGGPGRRGGPGGNPDAFAEMLFRQFDKNGDGVLNYDEMPENLRAERDKFDENKDGLIDLNEFKNYWRGRSDQIRAELAARAGIQATPGDAGALPGLPTAPASTEEEVQKRVVYRAGKLPKELPAWFAQYDTDGDGQIGLYEWKKTGRDLKEFQAMDRNGDGFLTAEEVLHYLADQNKTKGGTAVAGSGSSPGGGFPAGGPGGGFAPGGAFQGRGPGGGFLVGGPGGGFQGRGPGGPGRFPGAQQGNFPGPGNDRQLRGRGQGQGPGNGDQQPRGNRGARGNRQGGGGPG
jgi:Ca2+-binding EF-hand superfamily protein